MKVVLKAQFGPRNQGWLTHNELMRLKNMGHIQAYIKAYTSVMLEIKDTSNEGHLYHFMKGIQNWVQADLCHQGVNTIAEAIAVANKLLEFPAKMKDEVRGNKHGNKKGQGKFKKKSKKKPKNGSKHEEEINESTNAPKDKAKMI